MRENNSGNIPFYTTLAVIFIFATLGLTYMMQNSNDFNDRGTFGDMFGFANAMFTGLSIIGLLVTILLQREDLSTQREELKKQTNSINIQNFENTFFNLLNLQSKILENMELNIEEKKTLSNGEVDVKEIKYRGLRAFSKKYSDFYKRLELNTRAHISIYEQTYILSNYLVGPYFMGIYRLIKFVDEEQTLTFKQKYKYVSIIRSQLTGVQTAFLFYHCLHINIKDKFKPLVEKYAFFNNLEDQYIIKEHRDLYAKTAFELK